MKILNIVITIGLFKGFLNTSITTLCVVQFTVYKEGEHQKAFDEIKTVIAQETMLTYPDFSKPFHLHADASTAMLQKLMIMMFLLFPIVNWILHNDLLA